MARFLITVTCHGIYDPRTGYPPILWSETAYRDATTPKAAAVLAGMPKDAKAGRREMLGGCTQASYMEAAAEDGTSKTWHASGRHR